MTADIEVFLSDCEPDDPSIAVFKLGHVPRVGDDIILNACGDGKRLRVDRVEWYADDRQDGELTQVELYVTDVGWDKGEINEKR